MAERRGEPPTPTTGPTGLRLSSSTPCLDGRTSALPHTRSSRDTMAIALGLRVQTPASGGAHLIGPPDKAQFCESRSTGRPTLGVERTRKPLVPPFSAPPFCRELQTPEPDRGQSFLKMEFLSGYGLHVTCQRRWWRISGSCRARNISGTLDKSGFHRRVS